MKEINNEKNLKLINAKEIIIAYLMEEDLTIEEAETVLKLCQSELDAASKRQKFSKIIKGGE